MVLQAIAFYLLAATTVVAGLAVISARNPVHSVLFLITAFFSAAGLFVLMGAEFLAMILVVVYVGAVAVLFLFVVMMLDVDFAELRRGSARYLPIGAAVAGILTVEMIIVAVSVAANGAAANSTGPESLGSRTLGAAGSATNAEAIGRVLYTDYVYVFQAAGVVLLIAMIGAIVLTLKHRVGIKRQDVGAQTARTPATGMRIVSIRSGAGIEE
jgi:NADH-quinone oxidoreductase subunit J